MQQTQTRVLVMGSGALGGLFGAALARGGNDVTFVARGAQLEAMQMRGLAVRHDGSTEVLHPVKAVRSPGLAGDNFDLVMFCVKCYDIESAAEALRPALGPRTAILTIQNGVDAPDQLAALVGRERVLPGAAWTTAELAEPGVVVQVNPRMALTIGEPTGEITPRLKAVAHTLEESGFAITITADPRRALWEKFIGVSVVGALNAACQVTLGEIRDVPEGAAMCAQLIREATAVARASGVSLAADFAETMIDVLGKYPAKARASLMMDFERRRRVELEHLAGAVVHHGQAVGVPTPGFTALYSVLKVKALAYGGLAPAA